MIQPRSDAEIDRIDDVVRVGEWLMLRTGTSDTYGVADYTVQAFNPATGERREVFKAPVGADGHASPGPAVIMRSDHGKVVWSGVSKREPFGQRFDTYIADPSGGAAVLAEDAVDPEIAWPYVFARAYDPNNLDGPNEMLRVDLSTGHASVLDSLGSPAFIRASRGHLLVISRTDFHARLADMDGLILTDIDPSSVPPPPNRPSTLPESPPQFLYPASGDGFFTIQINNDTGYAYLIDSNVLVELGTQFSAIATSAGGQFAYWTQTPDQSKAPGPSNTAMQMIDVGSIPV